MNFLLLFALHAAAAAPTLNFTTPAFTAASNSTRRSAAPTSVAAADSKDDANGFAFRLAAAEVHRDSTTSPSSTVATTTSITTSTTSTVAGSLKADLRCWEGMEKTRKDVACPGAAFCSLAEFEDGDRVGGCGPGDGVCSGGAIKGPLTDLLMEDAKGNKKLIAALCCKEDLCNGDSGTVEMLWLVLLMFIL